MEVAAHPGFAVPPDDPAAWTRAVRLSRLAFNRIIAIAKALYLATGIALFLGMLLHGIGVPVAGANLVGAVAAVALVALVALPLRDPELRAATELLTNHEVRERRDWKRETGTRMPRGRPAIRHWLDAHPGLSGRGSLLVVIGRFAEAEEYWKAHPGDTPAEAFGIEVQRETAVLLAGGPPDIERLLAAWAAMPESTQKHHRRECLAALEAQSAVGSGVDPIVVLARARPLGGPLVVAARIPVMLGFHVLLPIGALAVATAVRVLLL